MTDYIATPVARGTRDPSGPRVVLRCTNPDLCYIEVRPNFSNFTEGSVECNAASVLVPSAQFAALFDDPAVRSAQINVAGDMVTSCEFDR